MQAEVAYEDLARAVKLVNKAVSHRPTLPVLGGMRLELHGRRLTLAGTDLEVTAQTTLETVESAGEGIVIVPGAQFAATLKARPPKGSTVALWHDKETGRLRVNVNGMIASLRLLDTEDYPPLANLAPDRGELVTSNLETVQAWITRVLPAASDDDARPVLTAVNIERHRDNVTAAATDSYRLHAYQAARPYTDVDSDHPAGDDVAMLVPAAALKLAGEAIRAHKATTGQVRAIVNESGTYHYGEVLFQVGPTTIVARCVEGEFPKWQALFPVSPELTVKITDATGTVTALKTAAEQGRQGGNHHQPVFLEREGNALRASVSVQDIGTTEIPLAGLEVDPCDTFHAAAFNPGYLADAVKANGEGSIHFQAPTMDGSRALMLKPITLDNGNGFRALVMPVRVP